MLIRALSADSPEWAALADYAASVSWRAGPFLSRLMRENRFAPWERVFAAYLAGEPVGFCTLTAKDEMPGSCAWTPFIGFVFVGAEYRGHRISEQLIAAACAYAVSLGYENIYLTSDEHGLYEKYGFVRRGTVLTAQGDETQLFGKPLFRNALLCSSEPSQAVIMIETERLKIHAASQAEMEQFIASQNLDVLKLAYTEMLNGCLNRPDQWEWHAIWMIDLKDGTHIGELCFKGLDPNGIAEIGYGISEAYRNHGYASEAVKAVLEWAFSHPDVTAIEAETDSENTASKRVLEKCGFIRNGKTGEEGPRYTVSRT